MSEMSTLPPTRAMIGKWSVDRYVGLLRRWILLSAAPILLLSLYGMSRTWTILIEAGIVGYIGSLVTQRGGGKTESITAGAFVGVALGLVDSFGRYIHHPTVATGLTIIIETVVTAILATIVAVSAALITVIIKQQKH